MINGTGGRIRRTHQWRIGAWTFFLSVLLFSSECPWAAVYEVGPGKEYETIGSVPWEALNAGDTVRIHWKSEPYREKWVICRVGTDQQPIVVTGIPDPEGRRPVIDGEDATTREQLDFWNEDRGVIKIGGANSPADTMPAHIRIENLEIRGGRPPHTFTGRYGITEYRDNCAAVYMEKGQHITIRNCILHDCGNGVFGSSGVKDLLLEFCHIYDNGIEGSIYHHNNYTECDGIVFQFNRFGPLRPECGGNNLKDRSAGTVIRYNWIEGGNRQLDLVDSDHEFLYTLPYYRSTYVYGNVLVEPEDEGNSQICHYGGDSGDTDQYRKGALYFYNNTVVSTRSGNTTLFRLSTNDESADCRNNICLVTAAGGRLAMTAGAGVLDLRNNWFKSDWVETHDTLTGIINDYGQIEGQDPGFVDHTAQDFRLTSASDCLNRGIACAGAVLPEHAVLWQYGKHQSREHRPKDAVPDLGAFERPAMVIPPFFMLLTAPPQP
ncbi:MAG: polysaccharide-degrading enzyme [Deltaproteobacteria bacterium]|nr:polysaccharide-degrading enzyme [Deltaproteobacteria bacterium]